VQCVGDACTPADSIEVREWRGDDGTCNGDSGGPALDAEGLVIGVTSRGPHGCAGAVYGGLEAWGPWISAVAIAAADVAGIPPPTWADATSYTGSIELPEPTQSDAAASCSVTAGASSAGGAALWIVLALALARRRDR
jgi:MYXO-CTERM domain-containing protein